MAKDEDDDDSLPPLAEKTKDFLDDAKKGKPRSFLLVCKGNKVKYLAVKKKPTKSDLNEAKKQGYKGDGYFGVITGSGKDLVFNLSMADGYTSEPVKDKSLKEFLEEHAELKCMPSIKIVATLPDIPFEEEELSHPLIARFIGMGEQISNVLDVRPEAEAELTKTVIEIRLLLQDGDFKTAELRITALTVRLQELLSGGQTTAPAATTPTSPSVPPTSPAAQSDLQPVDNDALKLKLQEALNKLVPQLKQAVATYPDRKVELLTPVAQIKKRMDAGELQEAKQGILAVGQLLKSVLGQGAAKGGSQQAVAASVADSVAVASETTVAVNSDEVGEAAPDEALDIQYLKTKAVFAAARSTWIRISDQAVRTIQEIRDGMIEVYENAPEMAQNLGNAVKELNAVATKFNDDLKLKFGEFIADPPPPLEMRDAIQREVLNMIEGYRSELESKPIFDILDLREYSDGLVKSPLLQALAGMAKDLA